jgi:hypothetical protein
MLRTHINATYSNAEPVERTVMESYVEYEPGYYRESVKTQVYIAFTTAIETEVRTKIMQMRSFCTYNHFVKKEVTAGLGRVKLTHRTSIL